MANNKKLIFIVSLLGLVIVGLTAALIFVPAPEKPNEEASEESGWTLYRNEKYHFEVKHPADWIVSVNEEFEPKINIYKKGETEKPPFIHHSNVTQVSFFPNGIGTEGVDGQSATSTVRFAEPVAQAMDFLLADGSRWATFATFKNKPASWQSFGFVWAGAKISNPSSECVLDGATISMEKCDFGDRPEGAEIVLKGSMNPKDRETAKLILESFRFF